MELDKREKVLMRALRSCPTEWADRKTLATALNLAYLNPRDIMTLELLAREGKIEIREVPNVKTVPRYEYRIK